MEKNIIITGNDQIESTKRWISEYYPTDKKILAKKLKEFEVLLKNKISFNSSENKLFDKKLN